MNLTPTKRQIIRGPSGITVVPCCPACPRAGEAGAALLGDGSILLVYARFHGGGEDHAHADLFGGHLDPVSGRLVDTRVFHSSPEALNQMSVSLERLHDGSLGMLFLRKFAPTRDVVCFSRSGDDGRNWSEPLVINAVVPDKYLTVNSDRLRQFSSGRLAVPAALYPEGDLTRPSSLALLYSDDLGASWAVSECVRISIQDVAEPHWILPEDAAVWKEARQSPLLGQEPGVEELADGRTLLYCRTPVGRMYQAYSVDGGERWSPFRPAPGIISSCSPQSIRRIPGDPRLLCVYNDRSAAPFGCRSANWDWRTPLTLAVSDDHGATWRTLGDVEDESHNCCYTSMLFVGDKLLMTYYESENTLVVDGQQKRRNLASLKMRQLALDDILESWPGDRLPCRAVI